MLWGVRLAALQGRELACAGAVGEIGVHRGGYFVILARLADASEPLWACDLFRAQQLNVDRSGRGNETAFVDAVRRHARRDDVQLFRGASHRLWYERIAPPRPLRMLSVDGSHLVVNAFLDLVWGAEHMADGGIIALDDVLHPRWMGPVRALRAYWHVHDRGYERLRPLLIAQKRLFLTSGAWHARYFRAVGRMFEAKEASRTLEAVPFAKFARALAEDNQLQSGRAEVDGGDAPLWLPPAPEGEKVHVWMGRKATRR